MSDTTSGDDGEGRKSGGGGRKPSGGDRPRSGPAGGRGDRPARQAGGKPRFDKGGDRPRSAAPRGGKPSHGQRPAGKDAAGSREDRSADRAEAGQGKPFRPKSRGMLSHGASPEGGEARRPKSYGRLSHDTVKPDAVKRNAGKPERFEKRGRPDARGEKGGSDRRPRPGDERRPRAPRGEDAAAAGEAPGTMRIAKRLARAGIASRRDAEGMIADGRVKVNGTLLDTPAHTVSASDRIEVDGAPLAPIERTRLWLFHKPAGLVTTNRDPEGRPTVFERLPEDMPRVLSVGRLDINTEGLLLLTNDGGLARILELPATGWLRRYRVRAHGSIDQARLDELRQGIAVDGVFYGAIEASLDREQGANVWLTLGLREGKNREVKRILAHLGLEVNRLIRLSFGPFQLGDLAEGAVREIKGRTLRDQLGERLIAEAGADFDAPVAKPFSNRPVEVERSEEGLKPKKRGDWISASETAPNRKKARAAKREDALDRLGTKPDRPDRGEKKPFGDKRERPERGGERRFDKPRQDAGGPEGRAPREGKPFGEREQPDRKPAGGKRSANVWMAPGARPQGEKKKAAAEERQQRGDAPKPSKREERARTGAPKRSGPGGGRPRGSGSPRPPRGEKG